MRELAADAVTEFSGWDGRLSSTLRALVRRPGLLTLAFLEGRRARYISPLRLYLSASLVYFLLAAAAPGIESLAGNERGLRVTATTTDENSETSRAARVGRAAGSALEEGEDALTAAERDSALTDIERAPGPMRPFLRRAVMDPDGFKRGVGEAVPKMLFALLPVFAGIVALFYRGRKYPEHLYFAIHLHAFIFLALAVSALIKFLRVPAIAVAASLITLVWIHIYGVLALQRVYGGSFPRTMAKWVSIVVIYAVTAMMTLGVVVYLVALWG